MGNTDFNDNIGVLEPTAYSVYARTDENHFVTKIFSDCFEQPQQADTFIKSGSGDEFVHVGYYELYTVLGAHRYKIQDGVLMERTPEEIAEETAGFPAPPVSNAEKILRLEAENEELKVQQAEQDEMILENNYNLLLMQESITDIV